MNYRKVNFLMNVIMSVLVITSAIVIGVLSTKIVQAEEGVVVNNAEWVAGLAERWPNVIAMNRVISVKIEWDDPSKVPVNHQFVFSPDDPGTLDDRRWLTEIDGGKMYISVLPAEVKKYDLTLFKRCE